MYAFYLVTVYAFLFRYQPDLGEESSDNTSESFSMIEALNPPSQPNAQTSKNVSMFTVFISERFSLYPVSFYIQCHTLLEV